jgi:hypothetical protein
MITLFKRATGLNTVANPRRVTQNQEAQSSDLGVAVDVMIDQTGLVMRRPSLTKVQDGNFHSLCSEGYVVSEGVIYSVNATGEIFPTRISGISGAKVSFCKAMGSTYFSNGAVFGRIEGPWGPTPYRGSSKTTKYITGPFPGQHLAFFAGRMFIAAEGTLYGSELFSLGAYHKTKTMVQLGTKINMVRPVSEGMFVSTDSEVWFLAGKHPHNFIPTLVCEYPALEWSDSPVLVEGLEIGMQNPGLCALWNSPEGAILGLPTGQIINLTKEKIIYPETVTKGFGCLMGYYFIHRSY